MSAAKKTVALIEGEDAAPEAMRPTVELIHKLGLALEWVRPPVGDAGMQRYGSTFPEAAREAIDQADTTLFGSTSGKSALALRYLRWGKRTYANVRPARWFKGCRSPLARPEGVDFVIVRENLEDLYVGVEGELDALAPLDLFSLTEQRKLAELAPGNFALKLITEAGTERVACFAFELARRRKARGHPGRVTCATKHNMLPRTDGLFRKVTAGVAEAYPDIEYQSFIVDDFARRLIALPHELDVVLLPNLYGDLLSDAAAGLIGGLGLAPSGCYGDDYAYFESAHGSAPDLAGQNCINPTATILSAVLMLDHLGFEAGAARLSSAVERVYAEGLTLTPDQGGTASTTEFCEAVAAQL